MLHFPTNGIDLAKLHSFIKPIVTDTGVDSYQYGVNLRIVHRDSMDAVNRVLDLDVDTKIDYNLFWEGFYYGIESVVEKCKIQ